MRSPRVSLGTAPVPFLSKSANASLYSVLRSVNEDNLGDGMRKIPEFSFAIDW
jgi:hypothetical protein